MPISLECVRDGDGPLGWVLLGSGDLLMHDGDNRRGTAKAAGMLLNPR